MSRTLQRLILFTGSGACTGYVPIMPGTAGTAAGILVYLTIAELKTPLYSFLTLLFIFFSVWISTQAEQIFKKKDPPEVVIDEVAGYLVTMAGFPAEWKYILAGFIVFRFMDIVKPYPANLINRNMGGGWGIVLDDIVAGIYANILLQILRCFS
jgi:phosphatidylglycerophosphatase A